MRNFFFMVFCMVALLLPENLWAQDPLSPDGKTLTITTSAPGQVTAAVSGLSAGQKAAITEIVLDGYFNSSDLNAIKGDVVSGDDGPFVGVKTVDMSEARFVTITSGGGGGTPSSYMLFKKSTSGTPETGTHAIVGGTLYQSARKLAWNSTSAPAGENDAVVIANTSDFTNHNIGDYGKIATGNYKYLQMDATPAWGNRRYNGTINLGNYSSYTHTDYDPSSPNIPSVDGYSPGQTILVLYYFKYNDSNLWELISKASFDAMSGDVFNNPSQVADKLNALLGGTDGGTTNSSVKRMWVAVSYDKVGGSWTNEQNTEPSGVSIVNADYPYEYRENHKDGVAGGTWVKMPTYNYYQLVNNGWEWQLVPAPSYEDGEVKWNITRFATEEAKNANTNLPNDANQYAIVGGTESYYNGTLWVDPSGETITTPNYNDMVFTNWSNSIETAITSKYAEGNTNGLLFQNCKSLTTVDFKAGNVMGFQDHKEADGYTPASLTVTIGKNVTRVAADAFQRCDALKTVTFDTDYSNETGKDKLSGVSYPLLMEIGGSAFDGCINLSGEVKIPNRVTSIGNTAFQNAGNNAYVASAAEDEQFYITFERRYNDDDPTVTMDCNQPLTIGSAAFDHCAKLKKISLPIRLSSLGDAAFRDSGLEEVEIREDRENSQLTVIPTDAFLRSKLKEVKIPRSVTEIKDGAFSDCPTIEKITFQEQIVKNNAPQQTLTIRSGAFSGGNEQDQKLKDVYVNFTHNKRLIICEYNAFSFTSMVGQTSVSSNQIAYLHFPEEDWDYYAGDWKRGMAFLQSNLNSIKGGYTDGNHPEFKGMANGVSMETSGTYAGKYRGELTGVDQYTPANGWQQFARTSTNIDIDIPAGTNFMRTYSTKTPYSIPVFATNGDLPSPNPQELTVGDPLFKIYRITGYNDGYKDGDDVETTSVPTRTANATEIKETYDTSGAKAKYYIPANSGLIMVGNGISAAYLVYMGDISKTDVVQYVYNLEAETSEVGTNYLYPTCIDEQMYIGTGVTRSIVDGKYVYTQVRATNADNAEGRPEIIMDGEKIRFNPTIPHPYRGDDPQFRIFGFATSKKQFSRAPVSATSTRDKAYLKLTPELFHWRKECDGEDASKYGNDVQSGGSSIFPAASSAPIMLSFQDPEGNTTDVRMINPETMTIMEDCYYTLQGVKLNTRPTQKGIYIHNGKKVVIK